MATSISSLYPAHLTPGGPALSITLLQHCPTGILSRADAQLLLIGCRHGENAIALSSVFAGGIIGIEEDPEAVLYGKMAALESGLASRVSLRYMSPVATNFLPKQFDVILLEGAFSSYPPGKILKEASRLLANDGLLLFSDSCWLHDSIPTYVRNVWETKDHTVLTTEAILAFFKERGFEILHSQLRSDVLKSFYAQFHDSVRAIAKDGFQGFKHMKTLVKHYKHEIDVYSKHGGDKHMGYLVLVSKRTADVATD